MIITPAENFRRSTLDLYGDPADVMRRVQCATEGLEVHDSQPTPAELGRTLYYREVDGLAIVLYPLLMGTVRITVGPADWGTYDDAWCYASPIAGTLAAATWDGRGDPPEGWFRNLNTARRRPGGDPALEYVAR